ncbi:methyl-accepting chemotaxis sensory transducer [Candidatus Vecturithrix granuli]|uniref:Methyl-accepting chemotaxis sensory transducer n=1 Tax=Vecturithrix granuli TaxID=1499967 RepID=A0A0S6WA62_VECG1|nr:methyl-accepting chemotaxis sensory transducer [Candidatus Vecturithrix granuli]
MPHVSTIVNEIRKFHNLVDALEILIYDRHKQLMALYRKNEDEEIAAAYFPQIYDQTLIPIGLKDDWFVRIKTLEDIPQQPLLPTISATYQQEIPENMTVHLIAKDQRVFLSFMTPIRQHDELEGMGIVNIAIREEDVERYARLTQTRINVFAENSLSVGTFPEFSSLPEQSMSPRQLPDIAHLQQLPVIEFSEVTIAKQQYYQGIVTLGTEKDMLGAITVHFPRAMEAAGRKRFFEIILITAVIFAILGGGGAFFLSEIIVRPIRTLTNLLQRLTKGDLAGIDRSKPFSRTKNEMDLLLASFYSMVQYLREMADAADHISRGEIAQGIAPRSEHDVLGKAFHRMIGYVQEIGVVANHVAQGDLRGQIALRSPQDQLGNAFMHMQEGLIALIAQIRAGENQIMSISSQVLQASVKSSDIMEQVGSTAEVTSSAMREVDASAEEVRMNTSHLASAVEETSASISQMVSSITHVADNSRKLSNFADETSNTVVNIVNSLEKVAEQAEHSKTFAETTTRDAVSGQASVEQMIHRMNVISEVTENISNIIMRLQSRSTEIGTILDVINDVAEQTSLLALNASIIAAQAGTQGRAFAVVADEIKSLATRVHSSTKEIAAIVKAVQHDSSDAVKTIEQGQQEVEHGVVDAHSAGEALSQIRQSAEESSKVAAEMAVSVHQQTIAHTHIVESIRDVTNMISEITRATQEQEKNSSQLFGVVENMQELASHVSHATEEQQKSTHHVTNFMEDVQILVEENVRTVSELAQSSQSLTREAELLKTQVKQFMLPEKERAFIK